MAEDDFDLGGFDEAYSPDDFSQADMDFATAVGMQTAGRGSESDSGAQFIANQLAQPQAGMNRSNVIGMANYDPTFAAAFDISRGLDPTNNMGGTGGLAVPSYLRPQIESGRVDARGEPIRYFSEGERVIQEDFTDFVRSSQQAAAGIPSLLSIGLDAIKSVFDGVSFLNDSKAGKTVEEAAEDQKRIEIADLEERRQNQLTDPSFMGGPIDTVTKTALDKLDDRPSTKDALNAISNMFNNRVTTPVLLSDISNRTPKPEELARRRLGINTLPQADNLQNQQIAAGEKTGQSLVDAPPRKSDVFPMSGGFILSQLSSDPTSTVNPRDNPRDPNNPGGTTIAMPEPPVKAPPGFVDIVMGEDRTPRFAGTNMSIYGGRGPGQSVRPKNELEAKAATDAGFSLVPFTPMFEKTRDPRDYTASGVLTGVDLPAAEFRFQREPEVTTRFKISDLPREVQEVVSLRSDLDYDKSFPLQTILDARREKAFTQKELGDFLAGFTR